MSGVLGKKGLFLVLSPLSVMENWRNELERYKKNNLTIEFHTVCTTAYLIWLETLICVLHIYSFAPSLTVLCYKGDKERRAQIQREMDMQDINVLLTTYEVCGCFVTECWIYAAGLF